MRIGDYHSLRSSQHSQPSHLFLLDTDVGQGPPPNRLGVILVEESDVRIRQGSSPAENIGFGRIDYLSAIVDLMPGPEDEEQRHTEEGLEEILNADVLADGEERDVKGGANDKEATGKEEDAPHGPELVLVRVLQRQGIITLRLEGGVHPPVCDGNDKIGKKINCRADRAEPREDDTARVGAVNICECTSEKGRKEEGHIWPALLVYSPKSLREHSHAGHGGADTRGNEQRLCTKSAQADEDGNVHQIRDALDASVFQSDHKRRRGGVGNPQEAIIRIRHQERDEDDGAAKE